MSSRDTEKVLARRKRARRHAPMLRERLLATLGLAWLLQAVTEHTPHLLRADFPDNAANAARALLVSHEGHPDANLNATMVDVQALLNGWKNEDLRRIIVAWCQMVVKMVDEGLYPESGDQVVLMSLAIITEATEVAPHDWVYSKGEVSTIRNVLMARAFERRYFSPVGATRH